MKNNGGIVSIIDNNGFILSQGNTGEALWCIVGPDNTQLCSWGTNEIFTYQYFAMNNSLLFTYSPVPKIGGALRANVYMVWYDNQPYMDMIYELIEGPQYPSGISYGTLLFPNNLIFNDTYLDNLYVPHIPGMQIQASFFQQTQSYGFDYPSVGFWGGVFHWEYGSSDGSSLSVPSSTNASFSIYDLSGPDRILPFGWQIIPITSSQQANDTWFFYMDNVVNITDNCYPSTVPSSFPSCGVGINGILGRRFLINSRNVYATMKQYVQDNQMVENISAPYPTVLSSISSFFSTATPYPSLLTKLGYDLAYQWFQAPMLKMDAMVLGLPFAQYVTDLYPLLPIPSVLHYVAYMVGGHDHSYPDFLPPDPRFNASSCDFASVIAAGNALGHITMPYTNPSWWCTDSPTVGRITNLTTISALNSTLGVWYEIYDDAKNVGIAVTPWAPAVQQRIDQFMHQFSFNVTTGTSVLSNDWSGTASGSTCNDSTVTLPCTFIFEDQLGARYPHADRSNYEQGLGAVGYAQGWLNHIAQYASVGLHSEQGVDRQARHILGYYGSIMSGVPGGPYGNIGPEYYQVVPLVSAVLRSHVGIFQHDLEGENHAFCPEYLSWNTAMGYQLSLDIGNILRDFNISWLYTVSTIQKVILSRYTHYRVTDFSGSIENITVNKQINSVTEVIDSNNNITSLSIFSCEDQPLLQPYFSNTYQVYRNGNSDSTVNISITYTVTNTSTLSLTSFVAPFGMNIMGKENLDVIGGLYQSLYNNAELTPGLHAIVEDRSCNNTKISKLSLILCVYHPTGMDTNITIVPPSSLVQTTTVLSLTVLDRANNVLENNVPIPLNTDGTLTVYWRTMYGNGTAYTYVLH